MRQNRTTVLSKKTVTPPDQPSKLSERISAGLPAPASRQAPAAGKSSNEASSEQVGGMSVSAREQVRGCTESLSILGTELSSGTDSFQEASDRAVIPTAGCHGVQRKADGIRCHTSALVMTTQFQVKTTRVTVRKKAHSGKKKAQTAKKAQTSVKRKVQAMMKRPRASSKLHRMTNHPIAT